MKGDNCLFTIMFPLVSVTLLVAPIYLLMMLISDVGPTIDEIPVLAIAWQPPLHKVIPSLNWVLVILTL